MKKPLGYILTALCLIMLATSCSITRNRVFVPDATRLELSMSDLEYLGETEISVEYRKYLGFITRIDRLNGIPYDRQEIKTFDMGATRSLNLYERLDRASYKLLEDFPEGDYFVVTNQTKSITRLFLGSQIEVKARVKAYSLK